MGSVVRRHVQGVSVLHENLCHVRLAFVKYDIPAETKIGYLDLFRCYKSIVFFWHLHMFLCLRYLKRHRKNCNDYT